MGIPVCGCMSAKRLWLCTTGGRGSDTGDNPSWIVLRFVDSVNIRLLCVAWWTKE